MAVVSAVVGGAAAVGSAYMSKRGAEKSARAQASAADAAAQLQHERYLQSREDFAPYRRIGTQSLRSLGELSGVGGQADFSAFERSPGHQFQLQQGEQAINRAASARGRLDSGATLQDLTQFNQGLARQEFGNYANRLASLAGIGQSATGSTANLGAAAASGQGNALMQAGQARASGYAGQANAINQGIGNLASVYGMYQTRPQQSLANNMQRVNGGWNF